jgi:outer membrane immunogenic protein
MRRVLITGLAVLGTVAQAAAADLPQPALPPAQAPVAYIPAPAVYNWGGIYYGINGGYGFGKSEWFSTHGTTGSFKTDGFAVGATIGANYQVDALVFGLEADLDWMGLEGTSNVCTPGKCETKDTYLATFRGRIGYAFDRVLFYATGGGAYGNIEANAPTGSFISTSKPGWTAGAGVEAALSENWTARVEYLFVDLQNAGPFNAGAPVPVPVTVKFDANLIRLGIDYKFR